MLNAYAVKENDMKKRSFVRALWGIYEHEGRRYYKRRTKMDNDIKLLFKNPWNEPFVTFTFGEDNHKYLLDRGVDSRLVDKKPILWDMDTEQFRHKLEVFKLGLQEFDEIVFLDWDTLPVAPLPENFWKKMYEKDSFQSPLIMYRRRKAMWRGRTDSRKLSSASFVYLRDKSIPEGFVEQWETMGKPWSEELVMSKYIDQLDGGWKGMDYYWEHHEPHWFALPRKYWSYTPDQYRNQKDRVFHHFDSRESAPLLKAEEIKWARHLQ